MKKERRKRKNGIKWEGKETKTEKEKEKEFIRRKEENEKMTSNIEL